MRAALAVPAVVLAALAGCEGAAPGPSARFWSLLDLEQAAQRGENVLQGATPLLPTGMPAARFVDANRMPLRLAWTDGASSAYVSTDLWVGYPVIWVQPLYALVTGRDANGDWRRLGGRDWILSVGPRSRFWSPYWQIWWVEVPEGTDPAAYSTVKRILDSGRPIHAGGARLASLASAAVAGGGVDLQTQPAASLLNDQQVARPTARPGWADGQPVDVLDFGPDRFVWNQRLEVEEIPLYMLFGQLADGTWSFTGLPTIGGTRPAFSGRPALSNRGAPAFGSLWRLHGVLVPRGAGVVLYDASAQTRQELTDRGFRVLDDPALREYAFKVVTDANCAMGPTPQSCLWLHSQAVIEQHLPTAIGRTEALVSCPYLSVSGMATRLPPAPPRSGVAP